MILAEFAHIATHGQVRDVEADPVDNWHNEDIEKNPDLYVSKYSYKLVKFASCTYYVTLIHLILHLPYERSLEHTTHVSTIASPWVV